MTHRFFSFSVIGVLALSALPAFAEDAMSSESTSSVSSSSASSVASQRNLGQSIKNKCQDLSGKSRELCVKGEILVNHKLPAKMIMKKEVKHMAKKTCNAYVKDSPEFHSCVKQQKNLLMEKHPKMNMMQKMMLDKKKQKSSTKAS